MSGLFGGGGSKISSSAPLVSSLRMQTSSYGRAIPLLYGKTRVASNVIWYGDFRALAHRSSQSAGGKGGGGGGGTVETVSYTYQTALLLGLCEGPVLGIRHAWVGKKAGTLADWNLSQFNGSYSQQAMPYLLTYHPAAALPYRGTACVGSGQFALGEDATVPNMTFEVDSLFGFSDTIRDANPADVVRDYCSNPHYGAGVPAEKFGDLTAFSDFCIANSLFISPAYTEQEPASDAMARLFRLTGSGVYYSEGKIKVVPYTDQAASGNGVTFTPNLTPVYDLDDEDFLADNGDDPVTCHRVATSDAHNCIRVKFFNRASGYNEEIAEAKDQASIEQFGLRVQEVELHEIADAGVARFVAQLILQRTLYVRNTYTFRLGWQYALLEPTDLVTLTDAGLGLLRAPVRITEIEEDEDGALTLRAEELPLGSAGATRYPAQVADGYTVNYNVPPGPVNVPVIFEPPLALAGSPEIWVAASGGAHWGGCDVWVSDDDATYQRLGRITGKSRHGMLATALAGGFGVDTVNRARVDLSVSGGELLPATQQNALDLVTLCYVDGELIAYRDATLVAPGQYDLAYLVRGAYGTPCRSHAAGSRFARLDQTLARFPYARSRVGKTVCLKFQSFNIYGGGTEDLADLSPVRYQITGAPLADVTGLTLEQPFTGRACKIRWDGVDAAITYTVEVWAGSPQALRRTVSVGDARRYAYSQEDARADGGPWRQLTFRVRAISQTGASGNWATLVASNPVPAALTGLTVTPGYNAVYFACQPPDEQDVGGLRIWLSPVAGFTVSDSTLVYDGPDCFTTLYRLTDGSPLAAGTPYYLKAAAYDSFGKSGLNLSSELSVVPVSVAGGIKPGEITASLIANGAIDATRFASGIQPVSIVSSLPAAAGYSGPRVVLLTSDSKLYRHNGNAWVATVASNDLSGQLAGNQLADGAITAAKIAAGVIDQSKLAADMEVPKQVSVLPVTYQGTDLLVLTSDRKLYRWNGMAYVSTTAAADITGQLAASQVAALEASKITGQLADSQLAGLDAAKLAGQIMAPQIANGAISPSKMLAVPEGFALNLDPGFIDPDAWRSHYNDDISGGFVTVADGKRGNRVYRHGTGRDWNYNRQPIPVVIGEVYRFSAWMRKSPDASSPFYFVWAKYNADGVYQTYAYSSRAVGTEWTYVDLLLTADAPFIAPGFALNHNGTAGYGEIQDFRFEAQLTSGLVADGAILATKIADNAITTAKLAAGAVVAGKIAANAVTATELAAGAVTTAKLAAGAVTASEIAAGAITGSKIAAATITGGHIAANAITAVQIAASAITGTELAGGSVTTAKLVAGAVTANELAANAVVAGKIAAGAISASEIAANAVVAGKIAAGAVGASEIAANAITTEKLVVAAGNLVPNSDFATGDFTNWRPWAGIANMAVLPATDPSVPPGAPTRYVARFTLSASAVSAFTHVRAYSDAGADTDGIAVCPGETYRVAISAARDEATVGAALQVIVYYRRADGSVGNNTQMIPTQALSTEWQTFGGAFTVPANCVRAFLYVYNIGAADKSGPVFWTHLRCTRMSNADLIVDGAVTAAKIQAGAVTTAKLAAGAVTANEIQTGAVVAGKIAANAVTTIELAADAVTTAKIAAGAVGASEIAAGAITTAKLAITPPGAALNADPGCLDSSAWLCFGLNPASFVTLTDGKVGNGAMRSVAGGSWMNSLQRIPADPGKTYRLRLLSRKSADANGQLFGVVALQDSTGANISGHGVQWAYLPSGAPGSTSWTEYIGYVGAGTSQPLPAAARTLRVGVILNYNGTTGYHEAQDIRLEEVLPSTLIQDGAITTDKIAANAITAGKIAANQISAIHVIAGSLTGDRLVANTITGDKVQAGAITASHIDSRNLTIRDGAGNVLFGAGQNLDVGRISGLGALATKAQVAASDIAVGTLSAIQANLGTVTAGRAQNASGSNFIDLNAIGTASFIKVGSAIDIRADGSGVFARSIISAPDMRASGLASVNSGWLNGDGSWSTFIDTGVNLPGGWASSSSDMYLASATIAGGSSSGGGANGYSSVEVVHGDGLNSGAPRIPVDNRIYIRFNWNGAGTSGGQINITRISWKLVRV